MIHLAALGFLVGALGLAVPIALHFMRRRPLEQKPFPSFRFLHRTVASRQNLNNLRKWIILALRCLALLLFALAFSWPYLRGFSEAPAHATVVLWDNSCSMQAKPTTSTLRDAMLARINSATETTPVLLGAIEEDGVEWSGKFSPDPIALRQWFSLHSAGAGSSAFEPPLRLADARLMSVNTGRRTLCLITDGQSQPWKEVRLQKALSPGINLEVVMPPQRGFRNLAITQAQLVEPFVKTGQILTLEIVVHNYQEMDVQVAPIVSFSGTERTLNTTTIPAHGSARLVTTLTTGLTLDPQFGEVRLTSTDDLSPDNIRRFCANPSQLPSLLATRQSGPFDFVSLAFALGDNTGSPALAQLDASTPEKTFSGTDAIFIRSGIAPREDLFTRVDHYLRHGGHVVVTWEDTLAMRQFLEHYNIKAEPFGVSEPQTLNNIDFEHPLFRRFSHIRVASLFSVIFYNPPQLTLPSDARTIASFTDGSPAIAELPVDQGRLIVVASAMTRTATDWPGNATFLPFWRELTSYCRAHDTRPDSVDVSHHPLPVEGITRIAPLGASPRDNPAGTPFVPDTPGSYVLTTAGGPLGICVNVPAQESDPAPLPDTFQTQSLASKEPAPPVHAKPVSDEYQKHTYWRLMLAAALLFACSELLLSNRTVL